MKLKKGRVATDLRQHFFTERVINNWNYLDSTAVEAGTLNTFKSKLQKLHNKDESFVWTSCVLLTPEAEPVPMGRPRLARYWYKIHALTHDP